MTSKKLPLLVQVSLSKLLFLPKRHFHIHLRPPRSNQSLKKYLDCNHPAKVLLLFRYLLRERASSIDSFSFLFALKACTHKKHSTSLGNQIHCLIIKFGFETIVQLQTCLLKMYSDWGKLEDAHKVFDEIPRKNSICWTSLISAYVENQRPCKGLQLFRQMQMNNVEPDQVTVTVALSACADIGALETGEWIHNFLRRKKGLNKDLTLNNALINMYAKCGDIMAARRLFDSTRNKDVTTWTSMIVGHALHGQAEEALELFSEISTRRNSKTPNSSNCLIVPNDVTFIGVLMACSHAGLVEEGKHHFISMTESYGIRPREPHFGCMVDLFCRAGCLGDAYDFIMEMPVRSNTVMWRTLLGACSLHSNIELGAEVRGKLLELDPDYVGDSVAMSNIYADKGMWNKKMIVRNQIKKSRSPGCSLIVVETEVNEFVTADDSHALKTEIYDALEHLTRNIKAYGYMPRHSNP
ncbi:putative pentatricopeptide repeat-containing protein At1g74400 [Neltuma alba]|uniref:putative pentatricopeptide repeat-containing protein At1g74400 n=1 Tax=Neltuma alba TaxID=207710 RepID=UPI0010A2F928|nr:putative pentatricopeptide repeat-containing protein At1g74400 [Prosopis alba]XP_028803207.1 putative pentatricopeptide repeat-containing protein At1g74400 [Prosopis alba]XP_028803208.1 putative pentatricopeptide repeat-containing protein At1g74400 [Prosopis alba]XP_028803209.1 putative pentatricopeptide repeat-containing protein At1g74400 [Prosopis alba]XP_028803210.1 putative pentatricopeptide repeat-containing protein At1g74400 [Prosopis alba]